MLRDLNISVQGRRDSTSPQVGVKSTQIPSGFPNESFLLNDVDPGFPNRLYSLEILTLPSAGVLYLDKAGVGSFTGAPAGTYTGTERVTKYDEGTGQVSTATGTYTITVAAATNVPTVTGVTVSPAVATGSTTFAATVTGTNSPGQGVNWSCSAGSITSAGVFTAPAATNTVQTITVTATSTVDGTKFGTATVTIAAINTPPVGEVTLVTVLPALASLIGGGTQQFNATVTGLNSPSQSVVWSASAGSISATGLFTAPAATLGAQVITITATSSSTPGKSGTATVVVAALTGVQTGTANSPPVDASQVVNQLPLGSAGKRNMARLINGLIDEVANLRASNAVLLAKLDADPGAADSDYTSIAGIGTAMKVIK